MGKATRDDYYCLTAECRFNTTHWSVVQAAAHSSAPEAQKAVEDLCQAYWHPLYAFIRHRGYNVEDAQDLTQAFLAELIGKGEFRRADQSRGKFRSFLLGCLKNFLAKDHREKQTLKRGGAHAFVPFDTNGDEELLIADICSTPCPERLFDQHWAMAVMNQALGRLREEMIQSGKEASFKELKVFLTLPPAQGSYENAALNLGLTPSAVTTAVHRLRVRFRELVCEILAQTVSTQLELHQEIQYLREVLTA